MFQVVNFNRTRLLLLLSSFLPFFFIYLLSTVVFHLLSLPFPLQCLSYSGSEFRKGDTTHVGLHSKIGIRKCRGGEREKESGGTSRVSRVYYLLYLHVRNHSFVPFSVGSRMVMTAQLKPGKCVVVKKKKKKKIEAHYTPRAHRGCIVDVVIADVVTLRDLLIYCALFEAEFARARTRSR